MFSQITVRIAQPSDLPKIMEIKADAYSVRGYCSHSGANEQYLKNKFALVAEIGTNIVGTMSVMYDQETIPSDEVFPTETNAVRKVSKRVAYYGIFAVKAEMWKSGIRSIGIALIYEAITRARTDKVDAAIILVHPRHVRLYKALGFKMVGYKDEMPGLGKFPVVMLVLTGKKFQDLITTYTNAEKFCIPKRVPSQLTTC
ncbi:MAG: GNAT family N-acetyltransferase [Minisyncoccota bacterium]